ncbi:T9SS type A sorting domain-containing protein [Flavobacterium sp. DGU11]|uniref:T9SS type A sorting domain-containing protein n=1 Tax=Flavobacterium arundinis TaxID=3139143 RepID=A0ABU9HT10_9FLAO
MKKNLLLAAAMLSGLFATAQEGYTTVNVSLQPQYASQVYYKFSTNTQTPVAASGWDLSFDKAAGQMAMGGIHVNDARIRVFQAAGTEAGYATVDVAQEATWTELFNSHLTWTEGAFDNADNDAPLAYGWGNYNMNSHHVDGVIVFVLKFADGSYKKLFLDDFNPYNGEITFKYASWNGTAWSADEVKTVNPSTLPSSNTSVFFSLQTNDVVTVAPADTAWDMVFRQYYGPVVSNGQTVMYKVTGALQSPLVAVAQVAETGNTGTTPNLPAASAYSNEINTIGDDWKAFNGGGYAIDPANTYYVKYADGTVFRMYFTSFSGSAAGTLSFNYKNLSATAGMEDFNKNSFGFYPNPSVDKNITLIYDFSNSISEKNTVSIYSMTGAKVFETELTNNSGFYTQDINLSALTSGMYIVTMQSGKGSVSKKLVIQ